MEESVTPNPRFSLLSIARTIWKKKIFIVAVWLAATVLTVVFVQRLPSVYKSESVILFDSQRIPEKFVSATVSGGIEDRTATINEQILSSGKLLEFINEFGLYREMRRTRSSADILDAMRKDISITLDKPAGGNSDRPTAFRIGYQGPDPNSVARVAARLAKLYVDENFKTRELQAAATSEFLDRQLQEAKRELDGLEDAVSAYKLKYNGELPQQQEVLAGTLSRLQVELEVNRDAINRTQQNKIILESGLTTAQAMVAAQVRSWKAATAGAASGGAGSPGARGSRLALEEKREQLEQDLAVLRARFGESYPDVVQLRDAIARLEEMEKTQRAKALEAMASISGGEAPAPQAAEPAELTQARGSVTALNAQIKTTDKELDDRRNEQLRILRDIDSSQKRLERFPIREREMTQITRDYEIAKENYKNLADKKIAALMALDMERRHTSERLTILDEARVPEKPIKPNRPTLYAIGSAAGLFLALILGFSIELRQNVFLGEWELPTGTVILARLPLIEGSLIPPPRPINAATARAGGA